MDPQGPVSDTVSANNKPEGQTTQETHPTTTTANDNNTGPTGQLLDDKEKVIQLYQTSGPHLWPVFNCLLQFCDAADEDGLDYHNMAVILDKVGKGYDYDCQPDATAVAQCAAAAGFVTQAVKVIREAIEKGAIIGSRQQAMVYCATKLLDFLVNFTYFENEVRLRLMRTGIFYDFLECMKLFRHISPENELEIIIRKDMIGIFLNSCKDSELAAKAKDMDIVNHITPFLDKRRHKDIRLASLFLLAYIVDDTQLGHLEMDHEMLEHSLCCIKQALEPKRTLCFYSKDTAVCLSLLARLQFNKKLIIAKEGAVELFKTLLQKGTQEDIDGVLAVVAELTTDSINASIFQRDRELMGVLTALRDKQHGRSSDDATKILAKIKEAVIEEDDIKENTSVADVLAVRTNALVILDVGKVEFLFSRLFDLTSGRSVSCCQVTGVKLLKALKELAHDEIYRREIMVRGGLDLLQKLLKRDVDDDRLESVRLLLELASCKEYSMLMQADTGLMESVQRLKSHGNQQIRQAADLLVDVIRNPGDTIIASTPP